MTHAAIASKKVDSRFHDRRVAGAKGVVDFYFSMPGWVDIDALVPEAVASRMFAAMSVDDVDEVEAAYLRLNIPFRTSPNPIKNPPPQYLHACQTSEGGMVLIDARVSVAVAVLLFAHAKRADVPINLNGRVAQAWGALQSTMRPALSKM